MKDRGERCDLEAGIAKLYASETAQDAAIAAMAIVGPTSQLTSGRVERLYRDTPLMIIGEGTNEIQRLVICRNLLDRYGERVGRPHHARRRAGRAAPDRPRRPPARGQGGHPRRPRRGGGRTVSRSPRRTFGELGVFGALVSPDLGGLGPRSRDLRHDRRRAGPRVGNDLGARQPRRRSRAGPSPATEAARSANASCPR